MTQYKDGILEEHDYTKIKLAKPDFEVMNYDDENGIVGVITADSLTSDAVIKRILEDQRISNELRIMYEQSKKFIEDSPDAWDSELIEHFIQKAEFILKGMIQKTG